MTAPDYATNFYTSAMITAIESSSSCTETNFALSKLTRIFMLVCVNSWMLQMYVKFWILDSCPGRIYTLIAFSTDIYRSKEVPLSFLAKYSSGTTIGSLNCTNISPFEVIYFIANVNSFFFFWFSSEIELL